MGVPVTGCRGGVRTWSLHCLGKGARFNNLSVRKLKTLLAFVHLLILCLIPKTGFGMGLQQ